MPISCANSPPEAMAKSSDSHGKLVLGAWPYPSQGWSPFSATDEVVGREVQWSLRWTRRSLSVEPWATPRDLPVTPAGRWSISQSVIPAPSWPIHLLTGCTLPSTASTCSTWDPLSSTTSCLPFPASFLLRRSHVSAQ